MIDQEARGLLAHIQQLKSEGRLIAEARLPEGLNGHFVAPVAFEIDGIHQLKKEHFGPVLHVARYDAADLEKVVAAINGTGYGLTLGVHSRNEETAERIERLARVGNLTSTATRSVRWWACNRSGLWPVRHRPEGGRPELPAALRQRAHHLDQHHGGGRQRLAAVARRRLSGLTPAGRRRVTAGLASAATRA